MQFLTLVLAGLSLSSAVIAAPPPRGDGPPTPPMGPPKPRPRGPMVKSKQLRDRISQRDLAAGADRLQAIASANGGQRAFGGPGHMATVDYIFNELTATNAYDVYKQELTATYSEVAAKVLIDGENQQAGTFTYAPGGQVNEALVAVANQGCSSSDYPSEVSGKVALVLRGSCDFGTKVALAGAAGAAAILIRNNQAGSISGTLGSKTRPEGPYVPAASLSKERGDALAERIAGGETVTANIDNIGITEERVTYNVIAETKVGNKSDVFMVGSHTDSVAAGAGINDNGSGTISLLTIAKQLARFQVKNAVRFGFWTAEEFGLLGSKYYVANLSEEERNRIRMYGNFDMVASPNYVLGVYDGSGRKFGNSGPAGSAEGQGLLESYFSEQEGLPSVPSDFTGRSDYGPFLDANIAAMGLFTGAEVLKTADEAALFGGTAGAPYDANYHKAGDDRSNVNFDAWLPNARAIAHAVATYAVSFDSLPPKEPALAPAAAGARVALDADTPKEEHRCGETLVLA